jgi:hypothetical protein
MRAVPYDATRQALHTPEKGVKEGETAKSIFPLRLVDKKFDIDPNEQAEIEAALAAVGLSGFERFNQNGSQAFAVWNAGRGEVYG